MFLLSIKNKKVVEKDLFSSVEKLAALKRNLLNRIQLLNLLKKTKCLSLFMQKDLPLKNSIKYIIGISLTNTNIYVYLSDIKGKIYFIFSSGFLGIKGKQKIRKPTVLLKLVKLALSKIKLQNNSQIGVHLKNFAEFYASNVLLLLKKYLTINFIRIFNNKPYNGCRPRKIKRKKRGMLVFK